jgi:hypothetical protein
MIYESQGSRADAHDSFYRKRRDYIDEVVFDKSMKPLPRLFGVAVAKAANRDTGDTFTDISTLGRRLGVKRKPASNAAEALQTAGRLEITQRGAKDETSRGRTHLKPVLKFDAPIHSSRGGKAYYEARGKFIEVILWGTELSPAFRLVGICVALLSDPTGWCYEGQTEIASLLGIARMTVMRAMPELAARGYMEIASLPTGVMAARCVQHHLQQGVQYHLQHPQRGSVVDSMPSKAISGDSGNPGNIRSPSDSGAFAAQTHRADSASPLIKGRVKPDLDAFDDLVDLIEQFCDADEGAAIRITDLIARANWDDHHQLTVDGDICPHFKAGLLVRVDQGGYADRCGKFFMITDAGHAARNRNIRQAA